MSDPVFQPFLDEHQHVSDILNTSNGFTYSKTIGRITNLFLDWGGAVVLWTMQGMMVFRISAVYAFFYAVISAQVTFFVVEIITMAVMKGLVFCERIRTSISLMHTIVPHSPLWGSHNLQHDLRPCLVRLDLDANHCF